ncbi:MAG: hypothetical protein IPM22_13315 [Betaproteobacteria bacterium]|nr:hypothetical protein [Betaproteobacteria bacterium]MCC7218752.1 hypothetical protein [Burkholderiales bacterium]
MPPPASHDPVPRTIAALLELMSEYAWHTSEPHERPRVAAAIAACLDRLAADDAAPAWLQGLADDLSDHWQPVAAHCRSHARAAARRSILALVRASLRDGEAGHAH